MAVSECPRCGKKSLRIVNVMGSEKMVYYKCRGCGYKVKVPYDADGTEHPEHDHNRAVAKEFCPWCHRKAKTITTTDLIQSFLHCKGYLFCDWSKERKWDNTK